MVVNRKTKTIEHKLFKDIINYFDDGDVMILNDIKHFLTSRRFIALHEV